MAPADPIEASLDSLHIHGGDLKDGEKNEGSARPEPGKESALKESNAETSDSSTPSQSPPIIICDAWYGFPQQKRPRKERINAVCRQLHNFLKWRSSESSSAKRDCRVSLLGSEGDVQAVRARMKELVGSQGHASKCLHKDEVDFQFNINMNEFLEELQPKDKIEVVYLSPDADITLSPTSRPPQIVIVGMLIDRRITTDRSRTRAEEVLKLRAVKLPLDELNVKELASNEPLNVDTVMELMQRWWWNFDNVKQQEGNPVRNDKAEKDMYRKGFVEAAAWAMKTQRERHPNRTLHLFK